MKIFQLGLAAVFNPENYNIQKKDRLPFIPGAFADPSWVGIENIILLELATGSWMLMMMLTTKMIITIPIMIITVILGDSEPGGDGGRR